MKIIYEIRGLRDDYESDLRTFFNLFYDLIIYARLLTNLAYHLTCEGKFITVLLKVSSL